MTKEDLQLSEHINLYPPRFVVKIKGSNTAVDSKAVFKFEGATKEIVKEIILTKGVVHNVNTLAYFMIEVDLGIYVCYLSCVRFSV